MVEVHAADEDVPPMKIQPGVVRGKIVRRLKAEFYSALHRSGGGRGLTGEQRDRDSNQ
jgi:hypothetical protein